jgi:hypothetical protein
MSPALAPQPALEFPEPRQPATFTTWQRGPTALSYDPYYVAPVETPETTTGTTGGDSAGTSGSERKAPSGAPVAANR